MYSYIILRCYAQKRKNKLPLKRQPTNKYIQEAPAVNPSTCIGVWAGNIKIVQSKSTGWVGGGVSSCNPSRSASVYIINDIYIKFYTFLTFICVRSRDLSQTKNSNLFLVVINFIKPHTCNSIMRDNIYSYDCTFAHIAYCVKFLKVTCVRWARCKIALTCNMHLSEIQTV